jgi:hypothetical protein
VLGAVEGFFEARANAEPEAEFTPEPDAELDAAPAWMG